MEENLTAKEMLKDHKHLTRGYYVFEFKELQAFVNQLCKEQRENDIAEIKGAVLFAKNSLNESIQDLMINAVKKSKQPEV